MNRKPTTSRSAWVFGVAVAIGVGHAVDDALINRQPGVGLGDHTLAASLSLALGAVAVALFPKARPGVRAP
jgi:hypothetical protein